MVMRRSHDLLQNDRHLLFFQTIGGGSHISLGVLAERRGVDSLDRLGKLIQSRFAGSVVGSPA